MRKSNDAMQKENFIIIDNIKKLKCGYFEVHALHEIY